MTIMTLLHVVWTPLDSTRISMSVHVTYSLLFLKRGVCAHSLPPTVQSLPEKSIVLLHACAHNPTGVDPKVCTYICIVQSCSAGIYVLVSIN